MLYYLYIQIIYRVNVLLYIMLQRMATTKW